MSENSQYQRYAFISYNHRDVKMAQWLHKKLESYKLPNEIHNEFEDSRYLRPVFRDQEDLNTGILGDELRSKLETSKYLIVICSPNSAHSTWVSDEVKTFIELGRLDKIIPFIIDGTPGIGGSEECFPEYLCEYNKQYPDKELLGVNLQEVGQEKSFIRIVSRMLDVDFDVLWKRHEREVRRRKIIASISAPIILFLLYFLVIPVSVSIHLQDEKHHLPPISDGILTINGAEYHFESLDTVIEIAKIPGYKRFQNIPYSIHSNCFYEPKEGNVNIGVGMIESLDIQMKRSKWFSIFSGIVQDIHGNPIEGALVTIESKRAVTNSKGEFYIDFPVIEQTLTKPVSISKEGYMTRHNDNESPRENLKYCIEND